MAPPSGWPPEGADTDLLYVLGFNGPVDAAGIGHPDRFVWRFAVIESEGCAPSLIAFSNMPRLMAFTRAINGRQAFALPTEARRCRLRPPGDVGALALWVDPDPQTYLLRYASTKAQERVIEGLEV